MKDSLKQFYKEHSNTSKVQLTDEAKQRVKAQVMMNLNVNRETQTPTVSAWSSLLFRSYVIVPFIIVVFVGGTTYVSAKSIPGDILYPVKRKVEDVHIFITPTESKKSELKAEYAKKRLEEYNELKKKDPSIQNNSQTEDTNQNLENRAEDRKKEAKRKAREDAKNAIEILKQTREDMENSHEERVKEIEDTLKEYEDENIEAQKENEEINQDHEKDDKNDHEDDKEDKEDREFED